MRYERARNAALLLGVGMGGFLDGIVLHQIAQWHQMLSAAVPPETMAVRGAGRLPSTRSLCGYMLVGWGAFNLAEGIVDHHLLELHHVRDLPLHVPLYDWIFLFVGGVGFILAGLAMLDGLGRPAPVGTERRSGFDRRSMVG
ncbi:MAG: hypothetical protein K0R40_3791 [Burkholderiales bacterium]|nr:hypothetical protein [Burkholderiales bacterium]